MTKANIGVIGLGVMGEMLALNMERNEFRVAIYNRSPEKVRRLINNNPDKNLVGTEDIQTFVEALEKPRRIIMMVPAGKPVDAVISSLKPLLDEGDLLIDGGNSHFTETERRAQELESSGVIYLGTGISGGAYGALWGPSIMPGGPEKAWNLIRPIFEAIAAKVEGDPCVTYIGSGGSGHYVKMVHNGIEYADMQLIAEAYDLLHRAVGLSPQELHEVFSSWNEGELESYLIQITGEIFAKVDDETNQPIVDLILDEAKQKGTGKWTSENGPPRMPWTWVLPLPPLTPQLKLEFSQPSKVSGWRPPRFLVDHSQKRSLIEREALKLCGMHSTRQKFALMRRDSLFCVMPGLSTVMNLI